MRVLVTGAGGFVGQATTQRLAGQPGCEVIGAYRHAPAQAGHGVAPLALGDFAAEGANPVLPSVDVVIHLAARAHVMNDTVADPFAEFRRVNVDGSCRIARAAVAAGARRFVYVSSIKVNGEHTLLGRPFRADDAPTPIDPYGISKLEAEKALCAICATAGLELVIVRPPLVYGPGVRANFRSMMSWLARGIPLPLGSIDNRRSLVGIDNLADLLCVCTRHPAAPGQTFLVSDDEDVSTAALLRLLGEALERPARLLPVPPSLLSGALRMLGKASIAQRLCESLQVDIDPTRRALDWHPPVSLREGLARAAQALRAEAGSPP